LEADLFERNLELVGYEQFMNETIVVLTDTDYFGPVIGAFLFLLTSNSVELFLNLVNQLQLLYLVPLFDVPIPSLLSKCLSRLKFSMVKSQMLADWFYDGMEKLNLYNKKALNWRFYRHGYKSPFIFASTADLLFVFGVLGAFIVIEYPLFLLFKNKNTLITKGLTPLDRALRFNIPCILLIETSLELYLMGLTNIRSPFGSTLEESYSTYVAVFIILAHLAFVGWMGSDLWLNRGVIEREEEDHMARFKFMYAEYKKEN